jgi:aryl-alcohol dehydrogenase-like predicted oxidoreductase
MRYRPLGGSGLVVSAVSLALTDVTGGRRPDWQGLVVEALENGINAFEIVGQDPAIVDGLSAALSSIERHLVFVAKRLGPIPGGGADYSAVGLIRSVEAGLARAGLNHFDAVLLHEPASELVTTEVIEALTGLREDGRTRLIGVAGEGPAIDAYISSRKFDLLCMPYSLLSGWITRNRIRAAMDQNMAIMGYDSLPAALAAPPEKPLIKRLWWGGKKTPEDLRADAYAFLHETYGWTAEEIALAYAMMQPALASVQINTASAARMADLCAVPERDMPPGLAPRIEMARFGAGQVQQRA